MNSFKDFYKKSEQLPEDNTKHLQLSIGASIQQLLLPMVGGLFELNNAQKAEKFSREVANYATSDEVISSLSKQIGEPRENETEQEFIERASSVLREILKSTGFHKFIKALRLSALTLRTSAFKKLLIHAKVYLFKSKISLFTRVFYRNFILVLRMILNTNHKGHKEHKEEFL
ncbi:hypothetical protein ACF3DV_18240 [Chlorogloeopsis fritschii PCC 9212]|uniref:Uncharacterized protein n=1 Tax=Chlorogloeopsis fritschii PCC 6912 TaxID=211165 RepID=A0A433NHN4_CHLFR|nr:hypothetical protein [Chlorogloeopsis fritschii]RUR81884.1 hypothetical protein PCC6912_27530 [Chlorogloeopsis fritschii PCC 6912]